MKNNYGKQSAICIMTGAVFMLLLASACTSIDPEYEQKIAVANTACTGKEVVGIWVSKFSNGIGSTRTTLLLRTDGTGRQIERQPTGNHMEHSIIWRFNGRAAWVGSAKGHGTFTPDYDFTLSYNGSELLLKSAAGRSHPNNILIGLMGTSYRGSLSMVFVRADDDEAVNEHLSKR